MDIRVIDQCIMVKRQRERVKELTISCYKMIMKNLEEISSFRNLNIPVRLCLHPLLLVKDPKRLVHSLSSFTARFQRFLNFSNSAVDCLLICKIDNVNKFMPVIKKVHNSKKNMTKIWCIAYMSS